MICPAIDNPISYAVYFYHDENMSAAEINHEFCMAYSQNIMSERTVVKIVV
jgi:hypothetical protein